MLEDEEEGMVLVDYGGERGGIWAREVEFLDEDDGDDEDVGEAAAEEIRVLVARAVAEIRKWDSEVGERVGDVLSGLEVL